MKKVFGYVRVSSLQQSDGASLDAQKQSIVNYCKNNNLELIKWFRETKTAAKKGRTEFNLMLSELGKYKANGVVFHKIDRSTRNHSDWAKLMELRDNKNISFYFAHESLDINTRGGMLTADIQVAIAKDYIENLRQEAKKGIYARLNQGIYPFGAPLGYINNGKGKVKTIDNKIAPLIKEVFILYTEQGYTINSLRFHLAKKGLTSKTGKELKFESISKILKNPFYIGLMKIKGKIYQGKHESLISKKVFDKAQSILNGKEVIKTTKHNYLFRKTITCKCGRRLIGEKQKGKVYYRCHYNDCNETSIREDVIENQVNKFLKENTLNQTVFRRINQRLQKYLQKENTRKSQLLSSFNLQLSNIDFKLNKLTNTFLESSLDDKSFFDIRESLLMKKVQLKDEIKNLSCDKSTETGENIKKLELFKNLYYVYELANIDKKREIIKKTTSNLIFKDKSLIIKPLNEVVNFENV